MRGADGIAVRALRAARNAPGSPMMRTRASISVRSSCFNGEPLYVVVVGWESGVARPAIRPRR